MGSCIYLVVLVETAYFGGIRAVGRFSTTDWPCYFTANHSKDCDTEYLEGDWSNQPLEVT